uniref:RNase H domain-containing protein n=1 Tax=Rhabditophanes sp. KR3021 TaxID=114890 RepID=A0AC35UIF5_9BILA
MIRNLLELYGHFTQAVLINSNIGCVEAKEHRSISQFGTYPQIQGRCNQQTNPNKSTSRSGCDKSTRSTNESTKRESKRDASKGRRVYGKTEDSSKKSRSLSVYRSQSQGSSSKSTCDNKPVLGHFSRLDQNSNSLLSKKVKQLNDAEKQVGKPSNKIVVYTDASYCQGRPAGVGIWYGEDHPLNLSQILPGIYNSCEAEIAAAHMALLRLKAYKEFKGEQVIVRTDFKTLIDAMNNGNSGRFAENYNRVRSEAQQFENGVTFEWIKSHNGEYGNEMADFLAKSATKARSCSRPPRSLSQNIPSTVGRRSVSAFVQGQPPPQPQQTAEEINHKIKNIMAAEVLRANTLKNKKSQNLNIIINVV